MRYVLGERTPVTLSYQFPSWILGPLGRRSVPISVTTTSDIPVMMSVREWFTELILVVTIGPDSVARFHFNRRDSFVVGRRRFVVDGSQDGHARREFDSKCIVNTYSTCVFGYIFIYILKHLKRHFLKHLKRHFLGMFSRACGWTMDNMQHGYHGGRV